MNEKKKRTNALGRAEATPPPVDPSRDPIAPHSQSSLHGGTELFRYDSMQAAASAMDVKLCDLKKAKRAGCPAFRGSRVYPHLLAPWLEEHKAELEEDGNDKAALECRKLLRQCERIEFDMQTAQGLYYKREDVHRAMRRIGEAQKTVLLSKCRNELAPKLHGLSIPDQFKVLDDFALSVIAIFERGVMQWMK